MRWWVALPLFAALAVGAAGCRSCDKVESELRAREMDVHTLKEENERLDCNNQALVRELAAVRGEPGPHGVIEKPSEPYPVRSLVVGRQTGGQPAEDCPGDAGLIVVIEPRDCDNQAIKAPGALTVELIERPDEGEKRLLWRWEISPDELRRTWQSGLFTTGYRLSLGFQTWPTTEKLRVVARFRMLNGRVFEADRDITIRLPPADRRRPAPPPSPPPSPPEPLHAPTPAEKPPPPHAPTPVEKLPPPTPVPDKPKPPPPESEKGPILTRGQAAKPTVQMFRPVPLENEE
jgi:hypothetical protein